MLDDDLKQEGIVVALKANFLLVEIDSKQFSSQQESAVMTTKTRRILCTKRNRLSYLESYIYVGDKVVVEQIDWEKNTGVVSNFQPRFSLIQRPPVANISNVFVVISFDEPLINFHQVSHFLLAAEQAQQKVDLVLTKNDLIKRTDEMRCIDRLLEWGYSPFSISIKNGNGIDVLSKYLSTIEIGVFCGPSGVGKSSLLNHLIPNKNIPVGELSKKINRGKNTTRHVELFSFNNNCLIADTPGFNRPEIVGEPRQLGLLFPEIRIQLSQEQCKFRDCLHLDEPGCVVSKNWERYSEYRALVTSLSSPHR